MVQSSGMTNVNVHEAKAQLSRYLKRVENGETVTICRRNKPIAEIRAVSGAPSKRRRRIGIYKGKFKVPKSFFDPLPDLVQRAFEGLDD